MWKAKSSMSLLIDKREKSMLSLRTFGADIVIPPTSKEGKLNRDAAGEEVKEEAVVEDDEELLANAAAISAAEEAALE